MERYRFPLRIDGCHCNCSIYDDAIYNEILTAVERVLVIVPCILAPTYVIIPSLTWEINVDDIITIKRRAKGFKRQTTNKSGISSARAVTLKKQARALLEYARPKFYSHRETGTWCVTHNT